MNNLSHTQHLRIALIHRLSYRHFVYQHSRLLKQRKRHANKFIESKPESVNSNNQSAALQLLLPNGVRIGVGHEVNLSLLQTVRKRLINRIFFREAKVRQTAHIIETGNDSYRLKTRN